MPWEETSTGNWQRSIGENERFIKFIGDRAHGLGREQWSVRAGATFTLKPTLSPLDLEQKCRDAWVALRHQHPSIAATAENDTLEYMIPSKTLVSEWAEMTLFMHEASSNFDDIVSKLAPNQFTTAHIFQGESNSTVLLHFAHWRTDGYGSLQLVNSFLDKLCHACNNSSHETALAWGKEVERLTPSIEEVLSLPAEPTEDIKEETARCIQTMAFGKDAIGVAMEDESLGPKGTRNVSAHFSEQETRAIHVACQKHNIDFVSAVHASCAAATYAYATPEERSKHYSSTMRFSLRPHLPAPFNGAQAAAALYTGGYISRVAASKTWMQNAKHYYHEYRSGITKDFLQSRRQYAISVLNILKQAQQQPASPPAAAIDISSVGNTDELVQSKHQYGDAQLAVQGISVGVETLTRQTYCFLWTLQGRLELSLAYNEAFYSKDRASEMVHKIADILRSELGSMSDLTRD